MISYIIDNVSHFGDILAIHIYFCPDLKLRGCNNIESV